MTFLVDPFSGEQGILSAADDMPADSLGQACGKGAFAGLNLRGLWIYWGKMDESDTFEVRGAGAIGYPSRAPLHQVPMTARPKRVSHRGIPKAGHQEITTATVNG